MQTVEEAQLKIVHTEEVVFNISWCDPILLFSVLCHTRFSSGSSILPYSGGVNSVHPSWNHGSVFDYIWWVNENTHPVMTWAHCYYVRTVFCTVFSCVKNKAISAEWLQHGAGCLLLKYFLPCGDGEQNTKGKTEDLLMGILKTGVCHKEYCVQSLLHTVQ